MRVYPGDLVHSFVLRGAVGEKVVLVTGTVRDVPDPNGPARSLGPDVAWAGEGNLPRSTPLYATERGALEAAKEALDLMIETEKGVLKAFQDERERVGKL